jgi:hypothetical protein
MEESWRSWWLCANGRWLPLHVTPISSSSVPMRKSIRTPTTHTIRTRHDIRHNQDLTRTGSLAAFGKACGPVQPAHRIDTFIEMARLLMKLQVPGHRSNECLELQVRFTPDILSIFGAKGISLAQKDVKRIKDAFSSRTEVRRLIYCALQNAAVLSGHDQLGCSTGASNGVSRG